MVEEERSVEKEIIGWVRKNGWLRQKRLVEEELLVEKEIVGWLRKN